MVQGARLLPDRPRRFSLRLVLAEPVAPASLVARMMALAPAWPTRLASTVSAMVAPAAAWPDGLAAGMLALASVWPAAALAATLSASHPEVLYVSQWAATDVQGRVTASTSSAHIAAPGSSDSGLDSAWSPALDRPLALPELSVVPLGWADPYRSSLPTGIHGVPGATAGPGAIDRTASLLDAASTYFAQQSAGLALRVAQVLRAEGVGEAWFSYRQRVQNAGVGRVLAWNFHTNAAGVWFASRPAFDATTSTTLAVRYTSLSAAAGLPASIAFRAGGWLSWQLRDAAGLPLGAIDQRDAQGTFDGAGGLACLLGISAAGGCRPDQPGVAMLRDRFGATRTVVDYVTALRPAYAVTAGGIRYALATLDVARTLQGGDLACRTPPLRFVNAFQAAFRLEADVQRFVQTGAGPWQQAAGATVQWLTGLQPWRTLALAVQPGQVAGLVGEVIDPDSGRLAALSSFPAGIQTVRVTPVTCQPTAAAH